MPDNIEFLKMKVLQCFQKMAQKSCNVTNLAKVLGKEKYSISRAIIALEKEGFINRNNPRHPYLTGAGEIAAKRYAHRMDVVTNHLIYEGVSYQQAQNDAAVLTMYCSDETFSVIQNLEEKYKIRYIFRNKRDFDGKDLCKNLSDGVYSFPFIIYRETLSENSNISMANYGFEHPCVISVNKGTGIVKLKAQRINDASSKNNRMKGRISAFQYYNGFEFCDGVQDGDVYSFPAECIKFLSIGNGNACILHGSVCLKMRFSVGFEHMPEITAVFTILI